MSTTMWKSSGKSRRSIGLFSTFTEAPSKDHEATFQLWSFIRHYTRHEPQPQARRVVAIYTGEFEDACEYEPVLARVLGGGIYCNATSHENMHMSRSDI